MNEPELQCIHCLREGKDMPAEYFVWYVGYGGLYTYLCAHHLALELESKGKDVVYEARNIAETRRLLDKRRKKR